MVYILYFSTICDSCCFVCIHIWPVWWFRMQSPSSQSSLHWTRLLHQAHNCLTLILLILSARVIPHTVRGKDLSFGVCAQSRISTNYDLNNLNPLRINALTSALQWAGNSSHWFWTFQFRSEESQNHCAPSVQSNMVAFDFSSSLQGGWVMIHRKNKHYPLWPSCPSAAWVNGTSSCFWAPPDKLTLW